MKFSYPEGLSVSGNVDFAGNASSLNHIVSSHTTLSGECTNSITLNGDTRYAWPIDGAPLYSIIMWNGAEINVPEGWAVCNGQTIGSLTLPDLRNRFIVGAGNSYEVSETGGAATVLLTGDHLPIHTHTVASSNISGLSDNWTNHTHTINMGADDTASVNGAPEPSTTATGTIGVESSGNHTHAQLNTASVGAGLSTRVAHNNLPPYYALYFIMKVSAL